MDAADLDELYGAPLDEFVSRRDAIAKRRRAAGQREAAASVKALRKPAVTLWAVNQLARRRADDVAALVEAAGRVRTAQRRAISGGGGGGQELRDASRLVRDLLERLVAASGEILAGGGHADTDATRQRVAAILRAAAHDGDAAPALAAGRLTSEPEAGGFGELGALTVLSGGAGEAEAEAEEERQRAEAEAEAAEAARAAREAAARERRREEARRAVAEARQAVDAAVEALRAAEARLAELDAG